LTAALFLLGALVIFVMRRRRRKQQPHEEQELALRWSLRAKTTQMRK
jgi:hypothetical protein